MRHRRVMAAVVALALAGCGESERVTPEATAEAVDPAAAAKELRALEEYCSDRVLEGRTGMVMSNTHRFTILDAARVYTVKPTNELRAALQEVDGCSTGTNDAVRAALDEAGRP